MRKLNTLIVAAVLGTCGIAVGPDVASLFQRGGDTHLVAQDADVPEQEAPAPPVEDIPDGAVSIPPAPDSGVEPAPTVPPESSEVLMPEPPVEQAELPVPLDLSQHVFAVKVQRPGRIGHGSAVAITPELLLTAYHGVRESFQSLSIEINGEWKPASLQNFNSHADVAVLRCPGQRLPHVRVSTVLPDFRDCIYVYGIKTAQQMSGEMMHSGIATTGNVATAALFKSEPGIDPGDSGGGVFNEDGDIVGVISHRYGNQQHPEGRLVGFTPLHYVAALVAPFSPAAAVSPAAAPGADTVTIISPATWHCGYCGPFGEQDFASEGLSVKHEKRDGLPSYPCTEWTDSRGVIQRLYGAYKPWQVKWSYDRSRGDCRCGGDPDSPDCECRKAGRECRCGT